MLVGGMKKNRNVKLVFVVEIKLLTFLPFLAVFALRVQINL
jgi:hypothetical protein